MKKNIGNIDRTLRFIVAITVAALLFGNFVSGSLGAVLGALAVVFVVTGFAGVCPLYTPFRFSTCRGESTNGKGVNQ
jgi:hypothetical protein